MHMELTNNKNTSTFSKSQLSLMVPSNSIDHKMSSTSFTTTAAEHPKCKCAVLKVPILPDKHCGINYQNIFK